MLLRWEPIVSENFPSSISFLIRIHGIPLHYWTEQALQDIWSGIGHVEVKDVPKGRIRLAINGLFPLETCLEINLPSGETKEVDLEYEKLEKHCFLWSPFSHDKDDCPSVCIGDVRSKPVGINQARTLEKLAERRRKYRRRDMTNLPLHTSRFGASHQEHSEHNRLRHSRPMGERDDRTERRDFPHYNQRRPQISTHSSSYRTEFPQTER